MDKPNNRTGYGRPPVHSQWQKGQSGNPAGRRKGQRNLKTDLIAELSKTISITENGVERKITKQQGLVTRLVNGAIQGDPKLSLALLRMLLAILPDVEPEGAPLDADDKAIIDAFLASQSTPREEGQ